MAETTSPDRGGQEERRAQGIEVHSAWQPVIGGALLVGLLAALADWRSAGASCLHTRRLDCLTAHSGGNTAWANSLLVICLLLVGLQLIGILLIHEHHANAQDRGRYKVAIVLLLGLRVALLVVVGYAVWWSDYNNRPTTMQHARNLVVLTEAALLALLLLFVLVVWTLLRLAPRPAKHEGAWPDDDRPTTVVIPEEDANGQRLLAIGASGGGIRAAAFGLGGHQAAQEKSVALGVADARFEPSVFAVSGGSYLAAALAMRRGFHLDGRRRDPAGPWRETYSADSPELQRLRRNTRYLYEPGGRLTDGLITLLFGVVINLFLVSVGLRFVVWLSAQLSVLLGVVQPTYRGASGPHQLTYQEPQVTASWHQHQVYAVPAVLLALVCLLTLAAYLASGYFDGPNAGDPHVVWRERPLGQLLTWCARRSRLRFLAVGWLFGTLAFFVSRRWLAVRSLRWCAKGRAPLVYLGLVWLVAVFLLPAAATKTATAALDNQPSAKVASVVRALGLVDEKLCRQRWDTQQTAKKRELAKKVLSQHGGTVDLSVSGGACGSQFTYSEDSAQGIKLSADRALRGRLIGIGTLLTLVTGLLRRGTTSGVKLNAKWFVGLRRRLVTWLPLTLTGVLAVYLSLLWSGAFIMEMSPADRGFLGLTILQLTVITTCAACAIAFLVDANVTSMHRFYRNSLASAFAVGVDDGKAGELPPERVYGFSALEGTVTPRLNVVTTLNTQTPGEAPTLRSGISTVFSPAEIAVFGPRATTSRPMADFETFAGPGRVSIMATVGMSGAAVSPLMGRNNERMSPYRLLLALFNLRLGTWVRNPAHTREGGARPHHFAFGSRRLWLTEKPGLVQMALEAVGRSSAERRWVYLSDGGHLDNTGLVECVRHALRQPLDTTTGRHGRILVMDASNDAVSTWAAVGDAVAVVYADLGVELEEPPPTDPPTVLPPWVRHYRGGGLEVLVVKAVRVEPADPAAAAPAPSWWDRLPANVQTFQAGHPDFPRASTGRQTFGDLEFEAYRALGHRATIEAFKAVGWLPVPPPPPPPGSPPASAPKAQPVG